MTQREGSGVSWESWIDRQIREAEERGEFDDLPGAGKPIPGIDRPHDELWWVKQLLRRENASVTPPSLAVRRDLDLAMQHIAEADSEREVRRIVEEINARIVEVNAKATGGPPSNLMPLDPDEVVRRWREERR